MQDRTGSRGYVFTGHALELGRRTSASHSVSESPDVHIPPFPSQKINCSPDHPAWQGCENDHTYGETEREEELTFAHTLSLSVAVLNGRFNVLK